MAESNVLWPGASEKGKMYKKYKPEFQSVEKALVCQKIPLHSVSPFFWVRSQKLVAQSAHLLP